ISSGSQSSLLLSSIEFKLTENDETFRLKDTLQKKYKVLSGECNGKIEAPNSTKQHLTKCSNSNKVCLEWKQMKKIGAGLQNLGNTCFMNSVLQCLSYIPPLVNFLLYSEEDPSAKCKLLSFCMTCELQKHIKKLYQNHGGIIKPIPIYQRLKSIAKHFQFGRQEDAHEFLRYVIDHMWKSCIHNFELSHNQKLDPASKETTMINHIFGGYIRSQVTCMVCKETSNTNDYFMDFILDIKNVGTLEKALEKFVQPETLQADNAYKCQHCKKKVVAQKRFTIHQAPNVATFQFKRFDYNRIFGGKITKHIVYPEELNLRPYMSETKGSPIIYKLNCVLVHLGATTNSGHYYCFVRNSNNVWYLMDDTRVSQVPLSHVLNQQAYILIYVRINTGKTKPSVSTANVPVKVPDPEPLKPVVVLPQKVVTPVTVPEAVKTAIKVEISDSVTSQTSQTSVNGDSHASTNSKSSTAWTVTDVNLNSPSMKSVSSVKSSSSGSWTVTDKPVNGFSNGTEKSQWTVVNINKSEVDNDKDIPSKCKSSSDTSSELSSSESSDDFEWVERTKETIEKERKTKKMVDEVLVKKWDEKISIKLVNGKESSTKSFEKESSNNSRSNHKDNIPITLNGMSLQTYGEGVRSWNGGPNEHDSVIRESVKRDRKYDEINEYNDYYDKGKVSSFVTSLY
ncbi:ubiquitin carboxyl-terminal hydrolase 36-like protein, partial [Leptotrombidium deliense]